MKNLFICAALASCLTGCGYANLETTKQQAPERWRQVGYEIIGYEGFQWGGWLGGCYGGATAWYSLRRIPDNGIIYTGSVSPWCGEPLQVYGPLAIDAIKPQK